MTVTVNQKPAKKSKKSKSDTPALIEPQDVNLSEDVPEEHPTATVTVDNEPSVEQSSEPTTEDVKITVSTTASDPETDDAGLVSFTVENAVTVTYLNVKLQGRNRSLNLSQCVSYDPISGRLTMTRARANAWKLAAEGAA